jgi:hypothetical protein
MNTTSPAVETQSQPFQTLASGLTDWTTRLQAGLHRSIQAADQNLGHLEETLLHDSRTLQRQVLEEAAQKKADAAERRCPHCGSRLTRCSKYHARTFESRFGPIRVQRVGGWCRRCHKWRYPADRLLSREETAGYSPSVQEMAALAVSKLPVAEASAVIERLAGVKIPPATLFREARRQGQRAQRERQQRDEQLQTPAGQQALARTRQLELPLEPYPFVIELDAWNIRERDHWGQSAALRARGEEPGRWHWVYGATCFRLDQRGQTAGERGSGVSAESWRADGLRGGASGGRAEWERGDGIDLSAKTEMRPIRGSPPHFCCTFPSLPLNSRSPQGIASGSESREIVRMALGSVERTLNQVTEGLCRDETRA